MNSVVITRRDFSVRLPALCSGLGTAGALLASGTAAHAAAVDTSLGLSQGTESIHQEVAFKASRKRIYQALTDTSQFDRITQLSDAMKSGMPPGAKPTQISREAGGEFLLFGGQISGRHVLLVSNERIVQAWRVADWNPGVYSIVSFELKEQGPGTKLVFDHAGFPNGTGQHLAQGWKANYWQPLAKFLT
jgi:activator of HSP90 ATPase